MSSKTCEVCGDVVTKLTTATTCGHVVALCETCKATCPQALRLCVTCEDRGVNPEPRGAR